MHPVSRMMASEVETDHRIDFDALDPTRRQVMRARLDRHWPAFVRYLTSLYGQTPQTQLLKAFSEMGELADATIKNDREGAMDAVGDTLVCLINYCALQDFNLVECLEIAYDSIKHRKGTLLPNGVFVKEV